MQASKIRELKAQMASLEGEKKAELNKQVQKEVNELKRAKEAVAAAKEQCVPSALVYLLALCCSGPHHDPLLGAARHVPWPVRIRTLACRAQVFQHSCQLCQAVFCICDRDCHMD